MKSIDAKHRTIRKLKNEIGRRNASVNTQKLKMKSTVTQFG